MDDAFIESMTVEHLRLKEITQALSREHEDLKNRPIDMAEHEAHRARLRAHIDELNAHIDRWRNRHQRTTS